MQENLTYFLTIKVPMIRKPFTFFCSFLQTFDFPQIGMPKTPRSYQLFWGRFQRGCLLMEPNEPQWYTIHFTVWTNIQTPEFYTKLGLQIKRRKSLPYVSAVYTVVGQSSTKKSFAISESWGYFHFYWVIARWQANTYCKMPCRAYGFATFYRAWHAVRVAFSLVTHYYLALKCTKKQSNVWLPSI